MLNPDLTKEARDFIAGRPPKHARQIAAEIHALCDEPEPPDSKLLKGSAERFRRADIGEYRIVYRVEADTLQVLLVGKRNDEEVYRRLRRR